MSASPLSQTHVAMIRDAMSRSRKIRRAAAIATASGWTLVVFAIPAILFGLFDIASAVLGAVLLLVAWGEFKGAGAVRKLDTKAPKRLAMNQAFLGLAFTLYGGWGIHHGLTGPSPVDEAIATNPEVAEMIGPMAEMWTMGVVGFYALFIVLSIGATGATALYYASRRRHIKGHLTATPEWVIDVQRAAA